jgi:hypothetical protein
MSTPRRAITAACSLTALSAFGFTSNAIAAEPPPNVDPIAIDVKHESMGDASDNQPDTRDCIVFEERP